MRVGREGDESVGDWLRLRYLWIRSEFAELLRELLLGCIPGMLLL